MTSKENALMAAQAASDKKAIDILIQDVSELLGITDYFVLATGANARQVDSIVDNVEEQLRKNAGVKPLFIEGADQCEWVLMDYGDFVVHVFQPAIRDFYRLETLWGDAPVVDLSEAGIDDPVYSERVAKIAGTTE